MKNKHNICFKWTTLLLWCMPIFMPIALLAQPPTARFYAHLGRLDQIMDDESGLQDETQSAKRMSGLYSMTWRINGHNLHFGDDTLAIAVDDEIDTIYYQRSSGERWDTLICSISKPGIYVFAYNDCCGAFDVVDPIKHHKIQGQVQFQLTNGRNISAQLGRGRNYLGMIGDAGGIIDPKHPKSIYPDCRSALIPNVYELQLWEIGHCKGDSCAGTVCQFDSQADTLRYDFEYAPLQELLHFYYLPLREEPLEIVYDLVRRTWEMH